MRTITMLLAAALCASGGSAQAASRDEEAMRRLRAQSQQLQRALAAEQQQRQAAELEAKKLGEVQQAEAEKLGQEADSARRRAGALARRLDDAEKALLALRAERDALQASLSDVSGRLALREGELTEMTGVLRTTSGERDDVRARADALGTRLARCEKDNDALYHTGIELLDRWNERTLGERVGQGEPFAQIGRVKLENLAEAWRDRIDEHRTPAADGR